MKAEDFVAKETYFLNREQTKVLPAGHPDAIFLLSREGVQLTLAQIQKYGFEGGVIEGVGKDGKEIEKPVKVDSSLVNSTKNTMPKATDAPETDEVADTKADVKTTAKKGKETK